MPDYSIQDSQFSSEYSQNVVQFTIHIYTEFMQICGKEIEVHGNLVKPKL